MSYMQLMKLKTWALFALVAGVAMGHTQAPPTELPTPKFDAEMRTSALAAISDVVTKRAFVPGIDFSKWNEFVTKRQTEIDAAETAVAFTGQMNRALRDFGFSHIRLQAPSANGPAGSTIGIGVQIEIVPDGILIVSVRPSSPAFRAGLKQDEIILKIDGVKATGTGQIRGEIGQVRTLEIRGTDGKVREVKITLQRIQTLLDLLQTTPPTTPPVGPAVQTRRDSITWPNEETALVRIVSFSGNFSRPQVRSMMVEAKKAKYLILDVRMNGGGAADNMGWLLSHLMPPKTDYGVFVSRSVANRYKEANPTGPMTAEAIAKWTPGPGKLMTRTFPDFEPYAGKIAVLINGGSGSASEITAATLQEQRGAILVGTKTAGAVLASVYALIPGGFRLQYPVSDYVTPKGVRLEGNPVKPTIEVTGRPTADGNDPVLAAAIEALRK